MREIDNYYLQLNEPVQSCFLALRNLILSYDKNLTEEWKYKMPFFCFKGKMFCYLWLSKKTKQTYIGIVEGRNIDHPLLLAEKRSRMKVIMIDPQKDLPVKTLKEIFGMALRLYGGER